LDPWTKSEDDTVLAVRMEPNYGPRKRKAPGQYPALLELLN
jgi:hypothetical protein